MRAVKFRAYDKEEEKMIYSDKNEWDYEFSFNGQNGKLACFANYPYTDCYGDEHDDWQKLDNIMQYVEYEDCHGKEIYEGDIVRYVCGKGKVDPTGEIKIHKGKLKVSWFHDDHGSEDHLRKDLYFWATERKIEIIGNIYEGTGD